MSKIEREDTFRGTVVDGGPNVTSNDNLQLVLALEAAEIWDKEEKIWVDWSDVEEKEAAAFLVLISSNGSEIFHYKMVEKAFENKFNSVTEFDEFEFIGKQIQFRTENSTYKEKTTLKVAGIDHYDAEPGNRVQKLDADKIKSLDSKYASFFRGRSGEKKPVKPVTKPKSPAKTVTKPVSKPKTTTPEKSTTPKKPAAKPKAKGKGKGPVCTENIAWKAVNDKTEADEKKLTQIWWNVIETLNPDGGENNDGMTPELWEQVRDITIARANEEA